jgi:hypothetical protein
VPINSKLGFQAAGHEPTQNGITYVPMVLEFEAGGSNGRAPDLLGWHEARKRRSR